MPADERESMRALSDDQIQQFIRDGFVRIYRAFPRELADEARTILWRDDGTAGVPSAPEIAGAFRTYASCHLRTSRSAIWYY